MNNKIILSNKFKKYLGSFRILCIQSNNTNDLKLIKSKNIYKSYEKEFHKKNIKLISFISKKKDFRIGLYGYDGKLKKIYKSLNPKKIFKNIEDMPVGKYEKKINNKKLSLYSNYHPEKSIQGTGFKDKETALKTIELIKNKPIKYQYSVVQTMFSRAKYHPYQTKNMKDAMKIFKKWLYNYKKR